MGWIFAERRDDRSVNGIARALNAAGVPCPSAADAERNPHRDGRRWTETCVATILADPRYTGYQLWNRQSTQHVPVTEDGPSGTREYGRRRVQRWNQPDDWVISTQMSHPALVDPEDFSPSRTCGQPVRTTPFAAATTTCWPAWSAAVCAGG